MKKTEKIQQLKALISQLGWSQKDFARRWYWEHYDLDDEVEIKRFEETFKKQLSRGTTQEGLIDSYINFLFIQREAKVLKMIKPVGEEYTDSLSEDYFMLSERLSSILKKRQQDGE